MSLFVEVNSVEKGCPVIVNLDHIIEIAPLASGGCALFTIDGAGMNSKNAMRVTDSYDQFKQFAMQTVSAEDIARRFPKVTAPAEAPAKKTKKSEDIEIPKFGE
jgi:hypothetical protein